LKNGLAEASAESEAIRSARLRDNFYRDGTPMDFPRELKTSSGVVIKANPNKTTTVLGTFLDDTSSLINGQLGTPKSTVISGPLRPGSFNLLNTPDELTSCSVRRRSGNE
jgi:filamentous hemagglutinin